MELIFGIILIIVIGLAICAGLKFLCAAVAYLSGPIQLGCCIATCVISWSSINLTGDAAARNMIIVGALIALFAALVYSEEWLYMLIGGVVFSAILCVIVFAVGGIAGGFKLMGIMSIVTIVLSAGRTVASFFGFVW